MFRCVRVCCVLGALSLIGASAVFAQEATRTPVPHNQVLSANPFGLMFEWFNADYERKINESSTWGLSGSFLSLGDDTDYLNTQMAYRYYPQGAALTGFYLGGKGGVHRAGVEDDSELLFGLGFELGYNWLLGARRNVSVGIGAGATRLFGGVLEDTSVAIPTLRLVNVGIAF